MPGTGLSEQPSAQRPSMGAPAPSALDREIETIMRSLQRPEAEAEEAVEAKLLPPLPMNTYRLDEFRLVMGDKRGILVQFGIRSDYKSLMADAMNDFHQRPTEPERRDALTRFVTNAKGWIAKYGTAERKAGKLDYLNSMLASAELELKEGLSPAVEAANWTSLPPSKFKPALLLSTARSVDQSIGMAMDIVEQVENLTAEDVADTDYAKAATVLTGSGVLGKFTQLKGLLDGFSLDMLGSLGGAQLEELITTYLDILDFFDNLGITSLLNAVAALMDVLRCNKRLAVAEKYKSARDPAVKEFANYAINKITRRKYSSIYLGIMHFVRGVSRIISVISGGTAAQVTEALNLSGLVAVVAHEQARNFKGVYKAALGTKGQARASRAALLVYAAARPGEGMDLLREWLKIEVIRGNMLTKAIQGAVWDRLWGPSTDIVRTQLDLAIQAVGVRPNLMDIATRLKAELELEATTSVTTIEAAGSDWVVQVGGGTVAALGWVDNKGLGDPAYAPTNNGSAKVIASCTLYKDESGDAVVPTLGALAPESTVTVVEAKTVRSKVSVIPKAGAAAVVGWVQTGRLAATGAFTPTVGGRARMLYESSYYLTESLPVLTVPMVPKIAVGKTVTVVSTGSKRSKVRLPFGPVTMRGKVAASALGSGSGITANQTVPVSTTSAFRPVDDGTVVAQAALLYGLQRLIFISLSSRPKYSGDSAMAKLRELGIREVVDSIDVLVPA